MGSIVRVVKVDPKFLSSKAAYLPLEQMGKVREIKEEAIAPRPKPEKLVDPRKAKPWRERFSKNGRHAKCAEICFGLLSKDEWRSTRQICDMFFQQTRAPVTMECIKGYLMTMRNNHADKIEYETRMIRTFHTRVPTLFYRLKP